MINQEKCRQEQAHTLSSVSTRKSPARKGIAVLELIFSSAEVDAVMVPNLIPRKAKLEPIEN